ncbi:hypothetical protein HTV45_17535 [Streptomyces sp. CHD11]|uniref:SCO4225 family membrane protein n=1 Tax=Streptomyces sp. CHD11 TaxID=2741325 RepID=UPI001BFC4C26|nr:hypothetical protein [Streptomyces sp. CHD11]MBT3152654.1 hypothetical protein [Streptomyces sp. CHD11]
MTSTHKEPTAVTGPGRSLTSRLRHVFGDIAALVYLGLIVALVIWAYTASTGTEDASFAGVIPLLATAPASLVLLVLPEFPGMFELALVVGALVNAAGIGWCSRRLRQGGGAAR